MKRPRQPYRQQLPALELSIESLTDSVPDDGWWYLMQRGELLGRFRSLKLAKEEWDRIVAESGWQPGKKAIDPDAAFRRESAERWSRNRAG